MKEKSMTTCVYINFLYTPVRTFTTYISSALLLISTLGYSFLPLATHASEEGQFYIITAYYSPLPDQEFYLKGSYELDIYLNGQGIAGASGVGVRPGMLAAPSSIDFYTRIDLTGIGVGTILDRGGAIVDTGVRGNKYTRLDLYVGSGEAGLCRALNFGVQTVYGTSYEPDEYEGEDTVDFSTLNDDCSSIRERLIAAAVTSDATTTTTTEEDTVSTIDLSYESFFQYPVTSDSSSEKIETLKQYLEDIEILQGPVNDSYDQHLEDSIYSFQKQEGIVDSIHDDGAGYFGPKTRAALKSAIEDTNYSPEEVEEEGIYDQPVTSSSSEAKIKELQYIFHSLGYFEDEPDGVYDDRLETAIYRFQLDANVISGAADIGSGYFGPKTRATLQEYFEEFTQVLEKIEEQKVQLEEFQEKRVVRIESRNKKIEAIIDPIPHAWIGMTDPEIRTLQKILKDFGYLQADDTAFYGTQTKSAVAQYQVERGVIDSKSHASAGVFGPATKQQLVLDLQAYMTKKDTTYDDVISELETNILALEFQTRQGL